MTKIEAYENSYITISSESREIFDDLVNIGIQIKSEMGLMSQPIQHVSGNTFYIGNIVGNLAVNDTNLVVIPKYLNYGDGSKESVETVVRMLLNRTIKCSAKDISSTVFYFRNNVLTDQNMFFDVLAKYFLDSLTAALKKSKICLYEDCVEKVSSIKGRVLVQRQLSEPVMDAKTWCKFRRFTINNEYNQLLFWACKYLAGLSANFDIKRKLINVSREFPETTDLLSIHVVKQMRTPRQFVEFEECISMAQNLYLSNESKKQKVENGKKICGYAINMERSFENIVCYYSRIASASFGLRHRSQASLRLATSSITDAYNYEVRPDDLISKGSNYLIVDAKYKALSIEDAKKKPSREDMYQMLCSCMAYDCNEAVLIYPETESFPQMYWTTDNSINGKKIFVRAASIDLSASEDALIKSVSLLLKNTNFYRENVNG